jgi:NAD(P)-dependent dehydrogenase (short-subunit alcohol dehydrogenase family)
MNKIRLGALSAALLAAGLSGAALADRDDDEHEGRGSRSNQGRGLAPVTNETYRTECGGCHFAYQPGLLPADAWRQLMGALDKHFGDDATLDPTVNQELLDYLVANAGGENASKRVRPGAADAAGYSLPRITRTARFMRDHDEIPTRLVKDNPQVKSLSNCQLCHRGAEQANFDEHQVSIAGAGPWND